LALTHYRLADAYDERDWIRARAHYAEALRLWRTIDHGWGICGALLQLGVSEHRLGDPKRAVACYREELLLAMDMNDRSLIAAGLVCLGEAASLTNQLASAADLLGASHALNFALGGIRNRVAEQQYQSTLARVRDGLPPDEFRTHWEAASAQPVEHVVQEALTMADILQSEA
jgi:tetratricopeptide (TPR) repeat protein